eukprot:TRINITY_DN17112_c0_g1_i1.p1 TRINITY_DN17112_c0_g1~~TRINITY_DN17112_c0_g1_i1.p1  ORF type:complete len:263 (-),score=80.32 TRINITY_DN17112_c0_g1_i1:153-941(-)
MEYNPATEFASLSEDLDETMTFGQVSPTGPLHEDELMALFNQSPLSGLPFDFDNMAYDIPPQNTGPASPVSEPSPALIKEEPVDDSTKSKKTRKSTKKARTTKTVAPKESVDDKYKNRLEANKKSAQQSRERKKNLKTDLEGTLAVLSSENTQLNREIIEMETENRVLKGEFIQLQNMISESAVLSKMMDRITSMNIPYPSDPIKPPKEIVNTSSPDLFSGSVDPTALMYMMVVLQSFNQHFTTSIPVPSPTGLKHAASTVA